MALADFEVDVDGKPIGFDGNTNLKRSGTVLPYTREHVAEYLLCKKNWRHFAENYHYIMNIDEGLQKIKMRDYQVEMVDNFINNRFNITLASRQIGKTTSFEVFVLHYILFNQDKTVAILANKAEQSKDILRKIKQAYELLPKWLQQGVKAWNQTSIRLENGCMVMAGSTSSTAIRGRAISLLIIDEFAFIPKNMFEEFYSSTYPTISSGKQSKVIFISTPNGLNHFYKFWQDALDKKNKFVPTRVDWWQVPGRDDAWKEETHANIGSVRFRQEYGNDFIGSTFTLIEPDIIRKLTYKDPIEPDSSSAKIFEMVPKKHHDKLRLYEEVKSGHTYAIGVDSAKMTEEKNGDNLCVQVLDITSLPYRQVCVFNAKEGFNYLQLPEQIYNIGKYYNWGYCFIENNEIGQEVANILNYDWEYENVFFERNDIPGFRTTKATKRLGYSNLKVLIESFKLEINDFETISELSMFVKIKDTYKAEVGYTDDLVMSLIAAIYFLQRKEYEAFEGGKDMLEVMTNQKVIEHEEDVPAFGFIDDGETDPRITNEFQFNEGFYDSEQSADW